MATQIVMDHTGDTRHQFDPADAGAVAEAERRFKELTGAGFTAARRLCRRQERDHEDLRPDSRGNTVHTAAPGRMIWAQLCADLCVVLSAGACTIIALIMAAERPRTTSQAWEKALILLGAWLSPEQAQQYESQKCFEVIGSDTGTRYRIRHGHMMNIDQLDSAGNKVCEWCFAPQGELAAGDCMLAQKIALETFETKALAIANQRRA
jgi:hypothetical protein